MREEDKKRGEKGEKRGGKARERPSTRISAAACVNPARRFAASREYRSPRHVDSFQSPSEMLYLFARCIKFCISPPPPKTHSRGISLCFPSLFPLSFSSVSRSLSFWYISSFVCERLPQTNWIRRGSQSYRITLTAEKCRSRWRILAEPSRSHALGTIREWKHSVARGKNSRIRSKFDPRDNFDGGRIFESIRRPSLKSKIDITFATPRDPKDFTIGMIPGGTSGFWNRIEGVILFRGEKSRETGRNFAASFAAGRDPRADAETPPVL